MVVVAAVSWQTSRRHQRRHHGLAAVAGACGLVALMLMMLSLGLAAEVNDESTDLSMSLLPPMPTLVLVACVLWRSLLLPRAPSKKKTR
jgi:hypothetical protein